MKEQIDRVTELTDEWRSLVVKDHCKDRDFHFHIQTTWSYGLPPKYFVQHYGYILHDFEEQEYSTYDEALDYLIEFLTKAIEDEKLSQQQDDLDYSH